MMSSRVDRQRDGEVVVPLVRGGPPLMSEWWSGSSSFSSH